MPHSRTAKKNQRQNVSRRAANRAATSTLRTELKRLRSAIDAKDAAAARQALPTAQRLLDKAAFKNRIHPNKAARLKSRLNKAIAALG